MSFLSNNHPNLRCGLIVDIGSGSVGVAIVLSDLVLNTIECVWSHREFMLIKEVDNPRELLREINTTLVNALLELGNDGLRTLGAYNTKAVISHIQVTCSAPWSYTATKTITYNSPTPVEIHADFIDDLVNATQTKDTQHAKINDAIAELGLHIISENVMQVTLNDYIIANPIGKKASTVSLSLATGAMQQKILDTLKQSCEKILPKVDMTVYTFMDVFYRVLKDQKPMTDEICLVDVTNEATEIGIVRDAVLCHVTHAPFGLYGLARLVAKRCNIPNEEAFSLLCNETGVMLETYPKALQNEINTIFVTYEATLAKLFLDTGDTLLIPRTLFVHTSTHTEEFFADRIKNAATQTTKDEHKVHLVTKELFSHIDIPDSALALSAHFFHTTK